MVKLRLLVAVFSVILTIASADDISFVKLPSYLKLQVKGDTTFSTEDVSSVLKGLSGMPTSLMVNDKIDIITSGLKTPKAFVFLPIESEEPHLSQWPSSFPKLSVKSSGSIILKNLFDDIAKFYGSNTNIIDMAAESSTSVEPMHVPITLSEVQELIQTVIANHKQGPVYISAPKMSMPVGIDELLATFSSNIATSMGDDFVVIALIAPVELGRVKRAASTKDKDDKSKESTTRNWGDGPPSPKELNVGKDYSDIYPVIFNIILWFMIAMGVTIASVAYCVWFMDPGKDGIIYRMTASRIKKDL